MRLADCEPGDVVRVEIDGEQWTIRLGMRLAEAWLAREVEVGPGRIHDRSEPVVVVDGATVLERLVDRAWYGRRSNRAGGAVTDPLLGGGARGK